MKGTNVNRDHKPRAARLALRTSLVALTIGAVFASTMPLASADELEDQRKRAQQEISQLDSKQSDLEGQIASQRDAVATAGANNAAAVQALKEAEGRLAEAEAELARAEADLKKSEDLDAQRAAELAQAEEDLEKAKADVAAAQAAYDSLNRRIDVEVSLVSQQHGALVNLALFLTEDRSAAQLNHQAQSTLR